MKTGNQLRLYQTWPRFVLGGIAYLSALVVFDYLIGLQIALHFLYGIPVVVAAWYGRRRLFWWVLGTAAICWSLVDIAGGHRYDWGYIRYWNVITLFAFTAVVAVLLQRLKESLRLAEQHLGEKAEALKQLESSTAELRRLEGSLQIVCAWTNQIKDGAEWVDFQTFMQRHLHMRLSHGISPAGLKKFDQNETVHHS